MIFNTLNPIPGDVTNDINTFDGGLNVYNNQAFIDDNQLRYSMNLIVKDAPCVSTRDERVTLGMQYANISQLAGYKVLKTYTTVSFYNDGEHEVTFTLLEKDGNKYFSSIYEGERTRPHMLENASEYYFCECVVGTERWLYMVSTSSKYKLNLMIHNPVEQKIEDGHYGIPAWHKDRLFLAKPLSNIIEYSTRYEPDNFETSEEDYSEYAGDFMVNTAKGFITSLISYDSKLIIFTSGSMHAMYGEYPSDSYAGSNSYQVVDIPTGTGVRSHSQVTICGTALYWYGTDNEIHQYNGAYFYTISKPVNSRYYVIKGGISNLLKDYLSVRLAGTYGTLYVLCQNSTSLADTLFLFDTETNTWWAEDGNMTSIAEYRRTKNGLLLGMENGDILFNSSSVATQWTNRPANDIYYDFENGTTKEEPIQYMLSTKTYGALGVDSRATITDVWLQCKANADVYLADSWTLRPFWGNVNLEEDDSLHYLKDMVHIGKLNNYMKSFPEMYMKDVYSADYYEQQRLIIPKMYGQRLDVFSFVIKGEGWAEFHLMKRNWRVS